jgi:cell division protein FtsN
MKWIAFSLLIFSAVQTQAQITPVVAAPEPTVVVQKDPRVDLLVKKQQEVNAYTIKQNKDNQRAAKGFRVQIINFSDRQQAMDAKAKIYTNFPELAAYMNYSPPYFRIRVGNFKTKDEAKPYKDRISSMFSNKSVYIVEDIVELKPEKNKEKEEDH